MANYRIVRYGLLGGCALAIGLIVANVVQRPDMVSANAETVVYLVILVAGLVLAIGAATAGTAVRAPVWRSVMADGCRWGLLFGALWVVEMTIANLAYGAGAWIRVPYFAAIWAVSALTVVAGAFGARRYRRFWAAPMIGVWSGLVSGLIGLATMQALALLAMPVLLRDPQTISEFASAASLPDAIAADFVGAGINHLTIVGLLIGSVLATVGGVIGIATMPRNNAEVAPQRHDSLPS